MAIHEWSADEEHLLIDFCLQPDLKRLYPDRRNELCALLAKKLNDHYYGKNPDYAWSKQLNGGQNSEHQGYVTNLFFEKCNLLFSSAEGTSSGSVRGKRKRYCPIPVDLETSIQYLSFHHFQREELYRYIEALRDKNVLMGFVALQDHAARMDYLDFGASRNRPKAKQSAGGGEETSQSAGGDEEMPSQSADGGVNV